MPTDVQATLISGAMTFLTVFMLANNIGFNVPGIGLGTFRSILIVSVVLDLI